MKITLRTELPQLALIAAMFVWAVLSWSHAPDQLPVHWNWHGDVDRYGGKFEGLLVIPLVAAAVYVMLLVLPRVDPGYANYPRFATPYLVIRTGILVLLASVYTAMQFVIRGHVVNMAFVVPMLVGMLFVVLGNFLGKVRPNWFVGIRTPWTLSSKRAWNKTHRLAGWIFILLGLVLLAAGLFQTRGAFAAVGAGSALSVIVIVVYSYLVWRSDPDRIPPTGTAPAEHADAG